MASHSSLYVVSGDVLGSITALLSDRDIGCLWFCGDSILNKRLENGGVRNFVFVRTLRRPLQLWPWMVAKFRGLVTFRFTCTYRTPAALDHAQQHVGLPELGTLSENLVDLSFEGDLTLHRRDVDFIVRRFVGLQQLKLPIHPKSLNADFPSLKFLGQLKLSGLGSCELAHLQNLSNTLTKLSLIGPTFTDRQITLPASITALTIRPHLNHIFESPPTCILIPPPNLTSLKFTSFGLWQSAPDRTWHTIPRSVTKLSLRVDPRVPLELKLLALLPSRLVHLHLIPMSSVFNLTEAHITSLPQTLEYLDLGIIKAANWAESYCNTEPGIFPVGLKTLKTFSNDRNLILPPNLVCLVLASTTYYPPLILPNTLTKLVDSGTTDYSRYNGQEKFPSLTKLKLGFPLSLSAPMPDQFPHQLVSARLHFTSRILICHTWPTCLTKLQLILKKSSNFDQILEGEQKVPWSHWLPPTLTSLAVKSVVNNEWMSHLQCPRLTYLLVAERPSEMPYDYHGYLTSEMLDHNCFPFLPPCLTTLTLGLKTLDIDSMAVLASQTPRLEWVTFIVQVPIKKSQTWPKLPNTLSRMHLYTEKGSYDSFPAKRNPDTETKFFSNSHLPPGTEWFKDR